MLSELTWHSAGVSSHSKERPRVTDVNMQWGLFDLFVYNHTNSVFYIILFCVLHFIEC